MVILSSALAIAVGVDESDVEVRCSCNWVVEALAVVTISLHHQLQLEVVANGDFKVVLNLLLLVGLANASVVEAGRMINARKVMRFLMAFIVCLDSKHWVCVALVPLVSTIR